MVTQGKAIAAIVAPMALADLARATPSATYWTPVMMGFQPHGGQHDRVDGYCAVSGRLPQDVGGAH